MEKEIGQSGKELQVWLNAKIHFIEPHGLAGETGRDDFGFDLGVPLGYSKQNHRIPKVKTMCFLG